MAIGEGFDRVLDAARVGADWAWAVLYDDLAPAVHGYLRARGSADPEDVTGQVFLEVVRGLHSFTGGEGSFRSWVFVIAHNRLLDERRRLARRPEVPSDELPAVHTTEDVEQTVMETLTSDGIRRLIEGLSPDQKDVLLLRILGGLTVEEVARAVGKRPGAVKALQHRGIEAIRRRLALEGRQRADLSGLPEIA